MPATAAVDLTGPTVQAALDALTVALIARADAYAARDAKAGLRPSVYRPAYDRARHADSLAGAAFHALTDTIQAANTGLSRTAALAAAVNATTGWNW